MPGLAGGSALAWQCADAVSNVEASAAIMRGYPRAEAQDPGHALGRCLNRSDPPFGAAEESSTFSSRGAQIRSLCAPASTESAEWRTLAGCMDMSPRALACGLWSPGCRDLLGFDPPGSSIPLPSSWMSWWPRRRSSACGRSLSPGIFAGMSCGTPGAWPSPRTDTRGSLGAGSATGTALNRSKAGRARRDRPRLARRHDGPRRLRCATPSRGHPHQQHPPVRLPVLRGAGRRARGLVATRERGR